MWIMTKEGHYSVVQHRQMPDVMIVRSRVRADLEAFRRRLNMEDGTAPIYDDLGTDYPFRLFASRGEFVNWLASTGEALDYGNFKNAVAEVDPRRSNVYSRVWGVLANALGMAHRGWWADDQGDLFDIADIETSVAYEDEPEGRPLGYHDFDGMGYCDIDHVGGSRD